MTSREPGAPAVKDSFNRTTAGVSKSGGDARKPEIAGHRGWCSPLTGRAVANGAHIVVTPAVRRAGGGHAACMQRIAENATGSESRECNTTGYRNRLETIQQRSVTERAMTGASPAESRASRGEPASVVAEAGNQRRYGELPG